jgi:predicted  nucleic acid-binding Zn-ribbon protein
MNAEAPEITRHEQTETFIPQMMPSDWEEQFKGLVVIRDRNGREILYGVKKEDEKKAELPWKILEQAIKDATGHEPVRWTQEEYDSNPDLWNARIEAAQYRTSLMSSEFRNRQHSDEIAELSNQIREANAQKDKYREEVRKLTDSVVALTERITALEGSLRRDNEHTYNLEEPVEVRLDGKEWTSGWKVAEDDAVDADDKEMVKVRKNGQYRYVERENIRREAAKPVPVPTPRSAMVVEGQARDNSSRWNSFRSRLGDRFLGWQVQGHTGLFYIMDKRNRPIAAYESEEDAEVVIEEERRRRGGAVLVGAAAVIGAGVVGGAVGWWLGRHTGHDHSNEINKAISKLNYLDEQNDVLGRKLNTANTHIDTLSTQLSTANDHIDTLSAQLSGARDQLHDVKHTVHSNHDLLVNLKHDEAKEALSGSGVRFSGSTHAETLGYRGDTVWDHARRLIERKKGRAPDIDSVRRVTSKILHLSGLRWNGGGPGVDAHRLPIGQKLIVPNSVT